MFETRVPKDIRKYETKIMGPLTLRQVSCVAIALFLDFILYIAVVAPLNVSAEVILYGVMIIDLPILCFGWLKPAGMPLERYITHVLIYNYLSPTKRKAKNEIIKTNYQAKQMTSRRRKEVKRIMKTDAQFKSYK